MIFLINNLISLVISQFVCDPPSSRYSLDNNVTLCIYLTDQVSNTSSYMAVNLKLDQYSSITLKSAYSGIYNEVCPFINLTTNSSNNVLTSGLKYCALIFTITIVAGNNINSLQAPYLYDYLVANTFNAVVTVVDGIINDIQWDNSYESCKKIQWASQTACAVEECDVNQMNDCDPTIYFSWIGTDKNGNNLLSAAYRNSQIKKFGLN